MAEWILDPKAQRAAAHMPRIFSGPKAREDAQATAAFLATLTGGYWLPRWTSEWRWTIRGSERWVAWDPNRAGTGGAIEIHGPQPQFHAMEEVFTLPPDPTRGYAGRRCLALLREWIANANGSPISARTTPESAIATLELVDAIQRSSREGRRIAIA